MTPEQTKQLYDTNSDFRQYVDNFCRSKKIIQDEGIFRFKMIQNVAEYYKNIAENAN